MVLWAGCISECHGPVFGGGEVEGGVAVGGGVRGAVAVLLEGDTVHARAVEEVHGVQVYSTVCLVVLVCPVPGLD